MLQRSKGGSRTQVLHRAFAAQIAEEEVNTILEKALMQHDHWASSQSCANIRFCLARFHCVCFGEKWNDGLHPQHLLRGADAPIRTRSLALSRAPSPPTPPPLSLRRNPRDQWSQRHGLEFRLRVGCRRVERKDSTLSMAPKQIARPKGSRRCAQH